MAKSQAGHPHAEQPRPVVLRDPGSPRVSASAGVRLSTATPFQLLSAWTTA